ncbi:MAG: aspartate aminotransferase family protein [candidate division NC10 bacterium]|nr:aspartate aminotransferase family protein [candidate division NC10 bacterium]
MATLAELTPRAQEILGREQKAYEIANPKSREAFQRSSQVLPGGVTRQLCYFPPFPCYADYGEGCWFVDIDGNRRLDLFNNATSLILGHRPPAVMKAVREQLSRGTAFQTNTGLETRLAERLVERVPSVEQIRFTNSGSEGTLMAVRAARAFTGRPKIAKMEGGYHGSHDAVEISVRPPLDPAVAGPAEAPTAVPGSAGIPPGVVGDVVPLPFNNLESARAVLDRQASQIAGIIVEPILGSVGFIPAEREFLLGLRAEAARRGMVFILDEVQSFRLSRGGAQALFGLRPDLTTFGKIIGGGFPVGAFGGRRDIMALFDSSSGRARIPHAGTFNGNPITMAAGMATLEQLTESAFAWLNGTGDRLRLRLRELGERSGVPMQVTGIGSMFKIHFSASPVRDYRSAQQASHTIHEALFFFGLNRGLYLSSGGRCCLSTAMGDAEVDTYLAAVEEFLVALAR